VSATAAAARPNPVFTWLGGAADAVARHVVVAVVAIVAFQVLATVALFFSVNSNGWLTYQGGDQIWLVTAGWLLGKGMMGYALTGHGWPMLLAPLTWITGSSSVQLLPLTTVLQVGVLAPIATLAVYDIGARIAGRLAGVWCAAAFAVAPFVAIPYFVQRYHDSWVDQFLPQALGLTQQADFPSVVAVLVSVAFTIRALRAFAYREAVLAGTFAGVALAFKPANALFIGGPLVAFALARRWTHLPLFLVSLAPALLALTIWKARGLGEVPLFAQGEATRLAAGIDDPVMVSATSWLDRTVHLDLDTWRENMSNIREFTWSARVLQFLPLAGAIAVARRSVPAAGLFLTWLLGYVVVKGAADVATIESGSYWRLIMPALPAFALLTAAVPLLVPTFLERMGPRLEPLPGRRPGLRATIGVVAFLAVVPITWLLASDSFHVERQQGSSGAFVIPQLVVSNIGVPADPAVVDLEVRRVGNANVLTWTDSTKRARTFYRVYRASAAKGFSEMVCEPRGVDRCDLRMETLTTTREQRYVDAGPPPDAIYRVGVAANWLDEEDRGDVFAISPPAAP
jgi:hypothetical protein